MARIRTVKPELWTDPEFVECSLSARLLFIASWNFATDYGVLPDKPRQLKMQCLPGDDCEVDALIEELVSRRFFVRRTAPNGDNVLVIRTFTKNQKINRATEGRWGDPAKWPKEDPPPAPLTEPSLSATPRMGGDSSDDADDSDRRGDSVSEPETPPADDDAQPDDDDFARTVELITDARCNGRVMDSPRAYRATVAREADDLDGDLIRSLLDEGHEPDTAARIVLGHGTATELAQVADPIPWCNPTCATCGGDAWVDAVDGLAPCPERQPHANGPPPDSNVVDMPARKLSRNERVAALTDNGAPVRFVDPGANPL